MSGFATGDFFVTVAVGGAAVVVLILATWLVGRALGRFNVIDVAWGLGFVVVAWVAFVLSSGHGDDTRRVVVALLVTVGAGRLAVYIAWRSRGKGEDPRYADMLEGHADPSRRALGIYLTQAVAIWFVSLPVMVAMFETSEPGALFVVGIVVWAIGFGFESIGDWQLARFRADPASKGQVMDHGLWRFTRHPNYFGDATMWWGIWLIAAQQWQGVITVLSPVLMTWTLTRKTGKPLLEQSMTDRRPGYREYVERTSGFFPLPPRRSRARRSA
jgi:steroid 5-alpha reductase family enzyme